MTERNQEVLDHGYLKLVEHWGSDERIVESARMSVGKGFEGWGPRCSKCGIAMVKVLDGGYSPADYERVEQKGCSHDAEKTGDERLLDYLWRNKHQTPFEMAGITVEVQAPIFVFREWHRHRVPFSYNEASARYAPLPDINYVPSVERLLAGGGHLTKQAASTGAILTPDRARWFRSNLEKSYEAAEVLYQLALQDGTPKELARLCLPVGRYSRMRASSNLRGWFAFLSLRAEPTAQWEIRQYAVAIGRVLADFFPRSWEVFVKGCPEGTRTQLAGA